MQSLQEESTNNKYDFIDLLKAIAIFFVVTYHYNHLNFDIVNNQEISTYLNYFLKSILSTCVPIFFFVNGALLLNKTIDLNRHIKKIITIVLLVIIWAILTKLILILIRSETTSIQLFIKSLWSWRVGWTNHLWFLQALVVIYVFYPLIKTAYDNEQKNIYFFFSVAFLATFGSSFLQSIETILKFSIIKDPYGLVENLNIFDSRFNPLRGIYGYSIVYFIAGGLLFKHQKLFRDKKWKILAVITLTTSMLALTMYGVIVSKNTHKLYDITWSGYNTIPTFLMVISIFIISLDYKSNETILSKLIIAIGKNSLGIYFTHVIWGSLLIRGIYYLPHPKSIPSSLLLSISITLISYFSVLILKETPVLRKLFQI